MERIASARHRHYNDDTYKPQLVDSAARAIYMEAHIEDVYRMHVNVYY